MNSFLFSKILRNVTATLLMMVSSFSTFAMDAGEEIREEHRHLQGRQALSVLYNKIEFELKPTGASKEIIRDINGKIRKVTTDNNALASYQLISDQFLVKENEVIKIPYKITVAPGGIISLGLLNTERNGWYDAELVLGPGEHKGVYKRIVPIGETETSLVFRNYHLGNPGQTTFTIEALDIQKKEPFTLISTGIPEAFVKEADGGITITTDHNNSASYQAKSQSFSVEKDDILTVYYKIMVQPKGKMSLGWLNTAQNAWYGEELVLEGGNTYEGIYKRTVPAGEKETTLVFRNYHLEKPGQTTFTIEDVGIVKEKAEQLLRAQTVKEILSDNPRLRENIKKIHPNNAKNYDAMGFTDLYMKGCFGQGTTIAVIEGGFYHTLDPQHRPNVANNMPGIPNNWYDQHKGQILPPLYCYDPIASPLHPRLEADVLRGKEFRFEHGDIVASAIAEAAPEAKILPVIASFYDLAKALKAVRNRPDVKVINLSRCLESNAHDISQLDPEVLKELRACTNEGKIIVLSPSNILGFIPERSSIHNIIENSNAADRHSITIHNALKGLNTSFEYAFVNEVKNTLHLENNTADPIALEKMRKALYVCNFSANLISDLFQKMQPNDSLKSHVVIAGNLNTANNEMADNSMGAGPGPAQQNYMVINGTYYSQIMDTSTSATSISAPHLAALIACLMSIQEGIPSSEILGALFESADRNNRSPLIYGQGIARAVPAYQRLSAAYR